MAADFEKKVEAVGTLANAEVNTFTDPRDNQTYRTVKIGKLTWMAENLNYEIADSWCYDNDPVSGAKYGRLYTWDAARKACPAGWRLPKDRDWDSLMTAVGGVKRDLWSSMPSIATVVVDWEDAGTKLKSQTDWNTGKGYIPGTDGFGFSALPGGSRFSDGSFVNVGNTGKWWSATEYDAISARYRCMQYDKGNVFGGIWVKVYAMSVRCIREIR